MIRKGMPKNTSIVDYCKFVLTLADMCKSEQHEGRMRKDLHCWYMYRQSFYGFLGYLDPSKSYLASKVALAKFKETGRGDDIRDIRWEDQKRFDKSRQQGLFHLEHIYTGDMFRKALANLDEGEDRSTSLAKIVQENYRVAWITKEENRKLKRGDRGSDLSCAMQYYKRCGVQLADNP